MSAVTAAARDRRPWPGSFGLLGAHVRAQTAQFVRVPVALFFTLALPLIMLVLFIALFAGGDARVEGRHGEWPMQQFYVGSLAAFSAVSGSFTHLANVVPDRRESGVLKRWRSTPTPTWIYLGGFVGSAVLVALGGVLVMLGVGVAFYGTDVEAAKVPAAGVTFLVGVTVFAALGMGVAGIIRGADASPAVANAIILPMAFISNTFVATDESDMPGWLDAISTILPLRPFVESMQDAFNPTIDAPAFNVPNLLTLAAWGVIGVLLAWRFFKWEPVAEASGQGRAGRRRPRGRSAATAAGD